MTMRLQASLAFALLVSSCGGGVASEANARRAYFGLDRAVDRALALGIDGFNAASSANIPPQMGTGDVSGTMTVGGQVSRGSGDNREVRLTVALVNYQDNVANEDGGLVASELTYATPASGGTPADLQFSLRGLPDATFTGSFAGTYHMTGELEGDVTLALTLQGRTEAASTGMGHIRRVAGSVTITGTVTSSYGTYTVNTTR